MKTVDQSRYLNLLGIPCWRSRVAVPNERIDPVRYYSLSLQNKKVILRVEFSSQPEAYEREQQLLKNMIRSLALELQELSPVDFSATDQVLYMKSSGQAISQPLNTSNVVYTHALCDMLLNPKLKADFWSCFKKLC